MPASPKPGQAQLLRRRGCPRAPPPSRAGGRARGPGPRIRGTGSRWSVPVPPQVLHVVADCMSPRNVCWTVTTRPWPPQSGQVDLARRPSPRPVAVAVGARRQAVVDDLLLRACGHLLQREAQAHAHVAAFACAAARPPAAAAEERAEDVAHAEAAAEQVLEVHVAAASVGAAAARRAGNGAEAVVLRCASAGRTARRTPRSAP